MSWIDRLADRITDAIYDYLVPVLGIILLLSIIGLIITGVGVIATGSCPDAAEAARCKSLGGEYGGGVCYVDGEEK